MSYRDDVARYQRHANERARRQWQNANEVYQDLQTQWHETLEEADRADEEGDKDSLNYAYDRLTAIEAEIAPYEQLYQQQQQVQVDPNVAKWDAKNKQFIERLERRVGPQGAAQTFAMADGYVTRPKIRDENNPQRTGMGIQRNSPAYFRAMEDMLELYSKDVTGVPYDPKDTLPDANEACYEISRTSGADYNQNAQLAHRLGKIGTGR